MLLLAGMKKPTTMGSLTQLLVQDPQDTNTWQKVTELEVLKQHLLQYSCTFFSQAHGTLYTVPPLSTLLDYDGLTAFGDQVHHGNIVEMAETMEHYTKLHLQHQKSKLMSSETVSQPLEYELLM